MAGKRETALVAGFLQHEADSADELAAYIIDQLDAARKTKREAEQQRMRYSVVRVTTTGIVYTYGPFPGAQTAHNAIEGGLVPSISGDRLFVAQMRAPQFLEELWKEVDAPPKPTYEIAERGKKKR